MSTKVFKSFAFVMLLALLAACASPATVTPQVIENTVMVKETVVSTVVSTVVAKETVVSKETVVVAAPTETPALSAVQEFRILEPLAFHAAGMLSPASERATGTITSALWLSFVGTDQDGKPVPNGLATSWDVAADNLSVTLHLRKDAKYSDGSPITAKEAAWSLNYEIMTMHPALYGQHDFFPAKREFSIIKGAQDVADGKIPADEFGAANVPGIKVIDAYTLEIDLVSPSFYILNNLQWAKVVKPESVMAGKGKKYAEDAYWPTEKGCVFSGAWMLQSFTSGSGMTLVPNPNGFGAAPIIKKINVLFVQDLTSAISAFENKEADWVDWQMTPLDVANLQKSDYLKANVISSPSLRVNQLFITPFKPMDDVHVRRAISMAIDRQALADVLGGGKGQKTYQVITAHFAPANPNCAEQFATVKPMPFDPAAAKAELALSPYASQMSTTELNMQLGMFSMPLSQDLIIAQVVQKMLSDNLGIKVVIHSDPVADFNKPSFPTHMWPNEQGDGFFEQMDFMNNLAALNSKDPLPDESKMGMVTLPRIPDLVDLMAQAAKATTLTDRCNVLTKAQQVWVDQVYTIDLFTYNWSFLIAPWVQNYQVVNFGGGILLQPELAKVSLLKH